MVGQLGVVGAVRDDTQHMLQDVQEVGLVEALSDVFTVQVMQQCENCQQARLCHIAHGVLEGPHDGVHDQLELVWRDLEQRWEAVLVDGLEKQVKVRSVLGEVLEIPFDHFEGAFEDSIEYLGNLRSDVIF